MLSRLRRLLVPPIFEDEEKTRASRFLINFSWVAICIVLLLILSRFFLLTDESGIPLIIFFAIIVVLLFVQYIIRLGYVNAASRFVVFSLWGMMTYLAWYADGIRDLAVIAYIIVIILASLLLGWRFALLVGMMSISVVWYFGIMEKQGLRVLHVDDPISYARDFTGIIFLIGVLVYLLSADWSRTLRSARSELQERLRAEKKLQQQADYLEALNETALGLLNRSELHPLLESILTRACDLLDTQHGLIEMLLPDESVLRQEVGIGVLAKYNGALTRKNEGVTGAVWENGQTLVVQNYPMWIHSVPDFVNAGFYAVLGVPLKVGNAVIGVLAVSFIEQDRIFIQEQINLMERFAALAAIAIDNARLYEQTQKELAERKAAELALRSSEERFRKVFNNRYIAISIVKLESGEFLDANDAFWELSGLQPEEAIGHTSLELNLWDQSQERSSFVQELLEKRSLQNINVEFKNKDEGPNRTSLAFYELIYIGDQLCILSMFYDISEQIQTQRALKASEERMRAIFASIPDMLFEISKDGVFLDFMASEDMMPILPPSQFIGRNVRELFPPTIVDQTFFALGRALETSQLHAFEYEILIDGEVHSFEARIAAITSESAIIMVRDISQNKLVQTEREKFINELEDKNSELERFTYTVSHDLKSPLITIKGFLGFLEQSALRGNTVRLKADIKRIADATDKMQLLLNDLLELSRVGRLVEPYQNINFGDLTHEVVDLLYGRLHETEIDVVVKDNLPTVYGDRSRLFEVLQNLIDNAAKFTGTQPNPRIEIGHEGFENGKPIFYVRDNGLGIELMHHDRVFGLFNKLDAQSEGTGIGLALVKRIIEVHKGRIWVESEVGQGSTFFFTLSPAD